MPRQVHRGVFNEWSGPRLRCTCNTRVERTGSKEVPPPKRNVLALFSLSHSLILSPLFLPSSPSFSLPPSDSGLLKDKLRGRECVIAASLIYDFAETRIEVALRVDAVLLLFFSPPPSPPPQPFPRCHVLFLRIIIPPNGTRGTIHFSQSRSRRRTADRLYRPSVKHL